MTTVSVNHNPTFPIPTSDDESFSSDMLEVVLAAVDADDHSANKGPAVKRVTSGLAASKPVAGNAGHLYIESDLGTMYYDDGSAWHAIAGVGLAQTLTGKTLSGPIIDSGVFTTFLNIANNIPVYFKNAAGTAKQAIIADSTNVLRIQMIDDTQSIQFRSAAAALLGTVDSTGGLAMVGFVKSNGYRGILHTGAVDALLQSGTGTSNSGAAVTVTFGTAFSSGTPTVTATVNTAYSATHGYFVMVESVTTSGFNFTVWDINTDARANAIPIMWQAVGVR